MTFSVGTQFTVPHADSSLRMTVTKIIGIERVALARSERHPDWGVVEKAFTAAEVESMVAWEERMNTVADANARFWATVTPGSILHYHNGFGEYVRCLVTDDHELKPQALVGNWTNSHADYYIDKIVNETGAWRPHNTCVFEAPGFVAPRHKDAPADPRPLEPLTWVERDREHGVIQRYKLVP